MNDVKMSAVLLGLLLCQIQPAEAAVIRIDQTWNHENFGIGGNELNLTTAAFLNDDPITGIGDESVLLDRFWVIRFDGALALNFSEADWTEPRTLTTEGNIFARFIDGVFLGLGDVNTGGAARTTMRTPLADSNPVTGAVNVNRADLVFHFPVSGKADYNLQTTTITDVTPGAVPEPSTLLLLGTGLVGLVGYARRRR